MGASWPLRMIENAAMCLTSNSDDARQHARAGRAVTVGELLAVPPCRRAQCRPLGGCRLRAVLRPAHGMPAVRNRRHRCMAELAGAAGAGEPDGGALALKSSISRLRLAAH